MSKGGGLPDYFKSTVFFFIGYDFLKHLNHEIKMRLSVSPSRNSQTDKVWFSFLTEHKETYLYASYSAFLIKRGGQSLSWKFVLGYVGK